MKQTNPQEIHIKTVETSSNDENIKKNTTVIEEESKKLLRRKGAIVFSEHNRTQSHNKRPRSICKHYLSELRGIKLGAAIL